MRDFRFHTLFSPACGCVRHNVSLYVLKHLNLLDNDTAIEEVCRSLEYWFIYFNMEMSGPRIFLFLTTNILACMGTTACDRGKSNPEVCLSCTLTRTVPIITWFWLWWNGYGRTTKARKPPYRRTHNASPHLCLLFNWIFPRGTPACPLTSSMDVTPSCCGNGCSRSKREWVRIGHAGVAINPL